MSTEHYRLDHKTLMQRVIFITAQLGMYHAELARVLHLRCADFGQLTSGQTLLSPDTRAWQQAEDFVEFYEMMEAFFSGDEVAMYHCLRVDNAKWQG